MFFFETKVNFESESIQHTLRIISDAAEKYAKDKGVYPSDSSDLYFSKNPYLEELYCDVTLGGYLYTCQFSSEGYLILAVPAQNPAENIHYKMITGGVLEMTNVQE